MIKQLLTIAGGTILGLISLAAQTDQKAEDFFKVLSQVKYEKRATLEPGAARSALVGASASQGVRAFEAATRLWGANRWLELEIAWLRQTDSQTRQFILALFYTQVEDTDIATFPRFSDYIRKFKSEEANQRQAELEWVTKENNAAIKSRIDALLRK